MKKKREANPKEVKAKEGKKNIEREEVVQQEHVEHRGNDEELKKNFEEEMKMAQKSKQAYYTQDGGIKKKYM